MAYSHKTSAFLAFKFANYHGLIEVGIAIAIKYMVVDALLSADPHLKFSEKIFMPEQYLHLTDTIMPFIEASTDPVTKSIHIYTFLLYV